MGRKKLETRDSLGAVNDGALIGALIAIANRHPFQFDGFDTIDEATSNKFGRLVALGANSRLKLANQFLPAMALEILTATKVKPTIQYGAKGFTLGFQVKFPSIEAALNYGLMLLLDVSKPYGVALSRCRRSSCQIFYLAKRNPKGGPANKHYCSPAHRDEAHDLRENRPIRKHK